MLYYFSFEKNENKGLNGNPFMPLETALATWHETIYLHSRWLLPRGKIIFSRKDTLHLELFLSFPDP
jgi:hypothetical protein